MGMTAGQTQAFKAASGNVDPGIMGTVCEGILFAVLFLWAAWSFVDVWQGWANQKVRSALMVRFVIKVIVLLLFSLWMFGS
uniref:TIGR03758 family integrating conjugative element protein n=1 Tax=Scandinavium goeteborgense TaxID=1851514 RepID=UPI00135C934E|nr:TIGR03758 family integrating conjugative element protein [Scandinavium goeteborgense]